MLFLNFYVIFVLGIENRVVLNIDRGIHCFLKAKVTEKHETFFCCRQHGKICILKVFIGGIHAY